MPQQEELKLPTDPMLVVRTDDGNFETKNLIKDAGSLRTFVGNVASMQNKKDVISNSQYTHDYRIPEQYLENLYQQSWIAKRIVSLPVETAMMNGFSLKLKNKNDEKKFWDAWEELKLNDLIIDTQKFADVYGSSVILLKNKNEDPSKPYKNFKNLEFIQVQYPFYKPMPNTNDMYETDKIVFELLNIEADLQNIAVFYGEKCIKRLSPQFKYFGMSVYQNLWKAIISDDLITTAVANMIYRSSTPVYKSKGFSKLVESGGSSLLLSKIETMEASRGIFGAIVQDTEDDFKMVGTTLAGLHELDRRSAERLCGAVGYPATLILGKSPDGMNATGEHDEKLLHTAIKRYQRKMREPVQKMAFALMDNLGIDKTDVEFEFLNSSYETKGEKAKTDALELDNAIKLMQVVNNPNIINRYLKECELITEDEFNELDKLAEDFDEASRFENEKEQIQADTDTETD